MTSSSVTRGLSVAGWLLVALPFVALFLMDLRLDYDQIQHACRGAGCNYLAVAEPELALLASWAVSPQAFAAVMASISLLAASASWALGALVLWRQGGTAIGWAVSLALVVIPVAMIADADNLVAMNPKLLIPSIIVSQLGNIVLLLFVYLFPNGRFYPRLAYIPFAVSSVVFVFIHTGYLFWWSRTLPNSALLILVTVIMLLPLAGLFQVLRYRHVSTALERQQTKWVVMGMFIWMLSYPVWIASFGGLVDIPAGQTRLLVTLSGWLAAVVLINALPITLAVAILRYRLWDVDLVIRRTLTYAALTGALALAYLGCVVGLQMVVVRFTGQSQSELVTVVSTLAIAALFVPLRTRLQGSIDRRFYRRKYDAAQAVAAFGARVRNETDLDRLSDQLVEAVVDTMQPASVGLWLRRPQP
jgi:hypothetical protein